MGVTSCICLKFGAVNKEILKGNAAFPMKKIQKLREDIFENVFEVFRAKTVHCIEGRALHAQQPHKSDVLTNGFGNIAARIDLDAISVKNHFEHRRRMIRRRAAPPGNKHPKVGMATEKQICQSSEPNDLNQLIRQDSEAAMSIDVD